MKLEIYKFDNNRFALVEEKAKKYDELIDVLKVDYLIFLEPSFYYDFKLKTFDKNGECFSLSCLYLLQKYLKDKNRIIVSYNQNTYEIFKDEKGYNLVLNSPLVINKYKDAYLKEYYLLRLDKLCYLVSFKKGTEKYYQLLKKKRKFNYYIEIDNNESIITDGDYHFALLIKEYLFELLNLITLEKTIDFQRFYNRNIIIKLKEVEYLYKCFTKKKELAA